MNKTEAIKQALDFLMTRRMGAELVIDALQEALTEQPAQQEPVAWIRWEWNRSGLRSLTFSKPDEMPLAEEATGVVYDPLYTSSPAQRKPLTRDQVKKLITATGYDTASPQERTDFINGIRHAEAAHGIKENT